MALAANKKSFGKKVRLLKSDEVGIITAFAVYERTRHTQFYVEYLGADSRHSEGWFWADQIIEQEP